MLVLHCSIATYARRVGKVEPVYLTDKINKMTSKHDCLGRPGRPQFAIHFWYQFWDPKVDLFRMGLELRCVARGSLGAPSEARQGCIGGASGAHRGCIWGPSGVRQGASGAHRGQSRDECQPTS